MRVFDPMAMHEAVLACRARTDCDDLLAEAVAAAKSEGLDPKVVDMVAILLPEYRRGAATLDGSSRAARRARAKQAAGSLSASEKFMRLLEKFQVDPSFVTETVTSKGRNLKNFSLSRRELRKAVTFAKELAAAEPELPGETVSPPGLARAVGVAASSKIGGASPVTPQPGAPESSPPLQFPLHEGSNKFSNSTILGVISAMTLRAFSQSDDMFKTNLEEMLADKRHVIFVEGDLADTDLNSIKRIELSFARPTLLRARTAGKTLPLYTFSLVSGLTNVGAEAFARDEDDMGRLYLTLNRPFPGFPGLHDGDHGGAVVVVEATGYSLLKLIVADRREDFEPLMQWIKK